MNVLIRKVVDQLSAFTLGPYNDCDKIINLPSGSIVIELCSYSYRDKKVCNVVCTAFLCEYGIRDVASKEFQRSTIEFLDSQNDL